MCPFPECSRPSKSGREPLCVGHYYQRLRGNPLKPLAPRLPHTATPEERFWLYVNKTSTCWLWTGFTNDKGYGHFHDDGNWKAHRWSYTHFTGAIPEGFHVDHLCRVPSCVRPDHLEAVLPEVNTERGMSFSVANRAKTHCDAGHPFAGDNLRIRANGQRGCRECTRVASAKSKAKRRQVIQAGETTD